MTSSTPKTGAVPPGGMWDKQLVYGGKRLQNEFAAEEHFVLFGIAAGGELILETGGDAKPVPKTVLTVARLVEPEERFEVGTLSTPIAAMVPQAEPDDFPVVAYWTTVPTDLADAVVLQAVGAYED